MERIAVGLDGSAAADAALRWAIGLATATDAGITAINAFWNPWSEVSPEDHARLLIERDDLLRTTWLSPAREAGIPVDAAVEEGEPRDVVLDAARSAGADVLVLGRTGSGSGPGFLHLGSLVEYAAHHTDLPLAVIPAETTGTIGRLMVGVDGSGDSRVALEWAGDVAQAMDAEVLAVQVMEPYVEWTPATSPENWRRDAERDIREWATPVTDAGVPVTPIAQRGMHPADGLLAAAEARRADVLVIGTRGLGGFQGLRAGGVALKVLHRAGLPLVLVPVE